jgi:hypothetical protein
MTLEDGNATPPCDLLKGYAPRFSGLHALRQRGVAKQA